MKDSLQLYRRLIVYIKPYWRVSLLSMVAMAVAAGMNPVLPGLVKPLLDQSLIAKNTTSMWQVPLLIVLVAVIKGFAEYVANVSSQWVANKAIEDLRRKVFDHQMRLPIAAHQEQTSGRMLSRITYDIPQVGSALSTAWIVVIQDSLTIVALSAALLWQAWHLTLVMLAIGPIVAWVIRKASRGMRSSNRQMQDRMAEMTNSVEESLAGLREIKVFGTQQHESSRFEHIAVRLRKETMRVVRLSAANVPLVQVLALTAVALVIYIASNLTRNNMLTPGEFVAYVAMMAMLFEPIRRLTNINATIQRGLAGAQSIFELLDAEPEVDTGTRTLERAKGAIELEHVSFRYPRQEHWAVRDFSLDIRPGETVALVGASGSGKTTLIALLARFFDVEEGRILFDGVPATDLKLANLRAQLAVVGQHAALFDDTVAANITYGTSAASEDEIIRAAQQSHAWEFIQNLPQGLQTRIGTNGNLLSGGQRQRVAIARAFLKNAPILLLDEATSALDNESERVVREALVELRRNRTVIVIAHRLSTIRDAHRIVVMEHGHIVEIGSHAELVAAGGAYAKLLQSGEEIIEDASIPTVDLAR
ncbi:MAG: lipid A export permease/ATP-binding protein MsbA [Rhodocyclaceae bacterium]